MPRTCWWRSRPTSWTWCTIPPIYAVVTQWYTQFKYVTDLPLSYIGGALILDKKVLDKIPRPPPGNPAKGLRQAPAPPDGADSKGQYGIPAGDSETGRHPGYPKAAEVEEFKRVGDEAVMGLDPKLFPKDIFKKVKGWLSEYRTASDNPQ